MKRLDPAEQFRQLYGIEPGAMELEQFKKNFPRKDLHWDRPIKIKIKDSEWSKAKQAMQIAKNMEKRQNIENCEKYLKLLSRNPFNRIKTKDWVEERKIHVQHCIYGLEANPTELTIAINNVFGAGTSDVATVRWIMKA